MSDVPPTQPPETVYRERCRAFEARRDAEARRGERIAAARMFTFLGALALLLWAELSGEGLAPAVVIPAGLLAAGFVGLVIAHRRVRRRRRHLETLRRVNQRALRRLARDWDGLPLSRPPDGPLPPHAVDLDLFGRASVAQLLAERRTAAGQSRLEQWLLSPASPDEVRERQRAVAELADRIDLRDELAAHAPRRGASPDQIARFLDWAEDRPELLRRPLLVWAARLIPPATVGLAVLRLTGVVAGHYWIIPLALGFLLNRRWKDALTRTLRRAVGDEAALRPYPRLFAELQSAGFESPRLRRVEAALAGENAPDAASAADALRRLYRIGVLADTRHSSFHALIQLVTLWDFHVVWMLERWQRRYGAEARRWFDALADAEALAALAALRHLHPEWTLPTVAVHAEPTLRAEALGHPLLPPDARVDNDVTIGPPGTFLFVTGSNMSGKSTLLRAIGANAVLAQAGGPVCAAALEMPPLAVGTSIRVEDSLEAGVSLFMAELQRLKRIVDSARTDSTERTPLFLLDEVLQGTNARERRIAARRVLRHLLDRGAIGAVTTHDLGLADSPELEAARRDVHFAEMIREQNGRTVLEFDYRLRAGLATTTNALALMEAIGLDL